MKTKSTWKSGPSGRECVQHLLRGVMAMGLSGLLGLASCAGAAWGSTKVEPWVGELKITTAEVNPRDARAIDPGMELVKHGGWLWSPAASGKEGVLVVHPPARGVPAALEMKLKTSQHPSDHVLRIRLRGSQHEPGPQLKVYAGRTVLHEHVTGKRWEDVEIPLRNLPRGQCDLRCELHPTGWMFEYVYIDTIEIGAATPLGGRSTGDAGSSSDTSRSDLQIAPHSLPDENGFRTWTSPSGDKKLRGKIKDKKLDGSSIMMELENGTSKWFETAKFSVSDQEYVRLWVRDADQLKVILTAHGYPGWKRVKVNAKAGAEPLTIQVTGQVPPPHPQIQGLPRPPFVRSLAPGESVEFEFGSGVKYVVEAIAGTRAVSRKEDLRKD